MEEDAILFQAVVPTGERRSLMNAWFKIQPTLKITGPFQGRQRPFRLGISSTLVESSLYTIGGRVPNHFVLSDYISWLDIRDAFNVWETSELPSPCADSVLGVYREFLCILPGVWKHGYYHMDKNKYLTTRKGYVWNTKDKEKNCTKAGIIDPPTGQWHRIRACAALDKRGLLIAMDGEENNFFLYKPEENDWEICKFKDPLPKFIGETSSAASNGRLYILEVQGMFAAFLYIYNIKEREGEVKGELVINKKPIREFDDYLWLMDKRDRVVRLVAVGDDKLCFLWLGPVSYENENMWPPVRTLHYLKFKVSLSPNPAVDFLDSRVFPTNITDLLDCLPCDPKLFGAEEVVMDPATTMAAGENAILFQAVVPSGERKLPMNAWFKIQPNDHILGPFHGRQPFRVGISSTFVGSSLYTIGGEVPSSRLPRPCDISWLDTRNPFNGWEIGELPSPCVSSVICFRGYSLYILTPTEGYIWNTKDNQCLETRICPPKVDGGDQKQRLRIRACAALDERGLLIAMDGENSTDFYLHPEPENEARDWETFGTSLPRFTNEISFAASKERLYILEFPNNPPASLYIYDTNVGNLIPNQKIDLTTLNDLWYLDKKDRVVRLVPVADDILCFLWLGPSENKNGWPPIKTLHYRKLKFPFNPNDALFETVESKIFPTNITKLLDCLPCGPEQFRAEVEGKSPVHHPLNAFPKQREDSTSAIPEAIPASFIPHVIPLAGETPLQDQAEDILSPKEERARKRQRTGLEDASSEKPKSKERLAEYANKKAEEGFDPTQVHGDLLVRDTGGVKRGWLKGLDIHTHPQDVGVSTAKRQSFRSIILESFSVIDLQKNVQTLRDELQLSQCQYTALQQSHSNMSVELQESRAQYAALQQSHASMQTSLQFLYQQLRMTAPDFSSSFPQPPHQ